MRRCLIWGTGTSFRENIRLVQYYEQNEQIKIVGITSNESFYMNILGYPFVEKCNVDIKEFDIVIVMSNYNNFKEIKTEVMLKGVPEEGIIPIFAITMPGFDFDKYISIKKDIPTIFAPNCWGGITYGYLGLEFKTPFINMFVLHSEYLKFLKNPKYYIECPLVFEKMAYDSNLNADYPVVRCGDIALHFNHCRTFEEALVCWERRKRRINWNNILVMFYSENDDMINEFSNLPYEKKICYVPYKSDNKNHIGIEYHKLNKPFWQIVNGTAKGSILHYDVFDLLLYGKITLLSEIC